MEIAEEFKHFRNNTSCLSVLNVPFPRRCQLAKTLADCRVIVNFFNYFEMVYCFIQIHHKLTEIAIMLLFVVIVFVYMLATSIIVNGFFTPVLKILSHKMHLNEYMAGITLLAFGNALPEVISNCMPVRASSALLARTVSSSVVIVLICGGMVCFLKPFKIDGHSTLRDLLFLLLALELACYMVYNDSRVLPYECYTLLSIYVVYLAINICDLRLCRASNKKLRANIIRLRQEPVSPERNKQLRGLIEELAQMEQHETVNINNRYDNYFSRGPREVDVTAEFGKATSTVDYKATKICLHRESNGKNYRLVQDFLEGISPIDRFSWKMSSKLKRVGLILQSPILLAINLFMPTLNYEMNKHGWRKLLNCAQIAINPFLIVTVVHSLYLQDYNVWIMRFHVKYAIWSLCVTVPLAIFVFLHSRTDIPPPYHSLFLILSISGSLLLIFIFAAEIEVLTSIVGLAFNLSGDFMDITCGSLINALADSISIFAMTMQGYEKMAFAAIFGTPLFSIVFAAVPLLHNERTRVEGAALWLFGTHGENCRIFLTLIILSTLWWCLIFNFYARRSAGVFYWIIFMLFLIYACSVEWNVIHEYAKDEYIEAP